MKKFWMIFLTGQTIVSVAIFELGILSERRALERKCEVAFEMGAVMGAKVLLEDSHPIALTKRTLILNHEFTKYGEISDAARKKYQAERAAWK